MSDKQTVSLLKLQREASLPPPSLIVAITISSQACILSSPQNRRDDSLNINTVGRKMTEIRQVSRVKAGNRLK